MATLAEVLRQAGYVTPQGQVIGPRTDLAQKLKSYVMNIPQNAAQNLANQRADIDAALTMGQGGIQIGDRAAFARQMAEIPNLMGLTAYHGTPHTIKGKFDINKVGTGEGAQAYGHGMYFAENPAVAKEYANTLGAKSMSIDGKPIAEQITNFDVQKLVGEHGKDLPKLKQELQKYTQKYQSNPYADIDSAKNIIKAIEENKFNVNAGGNLYKVDIPDEYIPNMLDWDKPLLQQTPQVQEALAKLGIKSDAQKLNEFDDALLNALLNNSKVPLPKQPINPTGQDIYQTFIQGNPQYTSQRLGEVGIRGIRYLDEGSRGKATGIGLNAPKYSAYDPNFGGHDFDSLKEAEAFVKANPSFQLVKPTSNFVVFEPSEVKILEQNSKPMTRKEIIEQELEKVAK